MGAVFSHTGASRDLSSLAWLALGASVDPRKE
jgi:hypothetical protein